MEMETRRTDRRHGIGPADQLVEVAAPDRATVRTRKDKCGRLIVTVIDQVLTDRREDRVREGDRSAAGLRLRRTDGETHAALLHKCLADPNCARVHVDVLALESGHLTPTKAREARQ